MVLSSPWLSQPMAPAAVSTGLRAPGPSAPLVRMGVPAIGVGDRGDADAVPLQPGVHDAAIAGNELRDLVHRPAPGRGASSRSPSAGQAGRRSQSPPLASPMGGTAVRKRCTVRSNEVYVPSFSIDIARGNDDVGLRGERRVGVGIDHDQKLELAQSPPARRDRAARSGRRSYRRSTIALTRPEAIAAGRASRPRP